MSSTNRNYERQDHDYYVTPSWAINDLLTALADDAATELGVKLCSSDLIVLDPCAGGDASHEMAYPQALRDFKKFDIQILDTVDIREDSKAAIKGDYLQMDMSNVRAMYPYDLIISNPPFEKATQFIQKALRDVCDGGLVVMLQRINFLGSKERKPLFSVSPPFGFGMPAIIYAHSKRMRFMQGTNPKSGKPWPGDSIEYAHFVWKKGMHPKFSKLRIL